jgi:hypothetical protein
MIHFGSAHPIALVRQCDGGEHSFRQRFVGFCVDSDGDDIPGPGHYGGPVTLAVGHAGNDSGGPLRGAARAWRDRHWPDAEPGHRLAGAKAGGGELSLPLLYCLADRGSFGGEEVRFGRVLEGLDGPNRRGE